MHKYTTLKNICISFYVIISIYTHAPSLKNTSVGNMNIEIETCRIFVGQEDEHFASLSIRSHSIVLVSFLCLLAKDST